MKKILFLILLLSTFVIKADIRYRKITVHTVITNNTNQDIFVKDSTFLIDVKLSEVYAEEYVKLFNETKTYTKNGVKYTEIKKSEIN